MTTYRLLITPEGDGAQGQGQAIIRVETAPVPRITEVTITASAAEGLSAATLPTIDLDGVLSALTARVPAAAEATAVEPTAVEPTAVEPTAAEPTAAEPAAEPARKAAPVRKAARAKKAAPARKASSAARKTDRPYRQMPDTSELTAVFQRIGSVTGVAEHYEVPRYTAQGWISRLRKLTTG